MNANDKTSTLPFEVHGIWAPGVVLMRNLSFRAKAFVIAAMFYLPVIVLLAWLQISSGAEGLGQDLRFQLTAFLGAVLVVSAYFFVAFYKSNSGGMQRVSQHLSELATGNIRNRPPKPAPFRQRTQPHQRGGRARER